MTQKSKQNLNILTTKRGFGMKQKAFFIDFRGLSVAKNYLRPESAPLRIFPLFLFRKMYYWVTKIVTFNWKIISTNYHLFFFFLKSRCSKFDPSSVYTMFIYSCSICGNMFNVRLTSFWTLGIKGLNQLNKISTLQLDNNNITCRGATALLNSVNNKSDSAIKEIHCIVGTLRYFFFCCILKQNSKHW